MKLAERLLSRMTRWLILQVSKIVWMFLKIEKGTKTEERVLKNSTQREIDIQILHSSFNQNYLMNLSDIYQIIDMGNKCFVYACKTNYSSER